MSKIKSYDIRYGVRNHTSTYTGTETAADLNPNNAFAVTLSSTYCAQVYNFDYTGKEQTFTAPCTGYYKLEVWGAQGGTAILGGSTLTGGYGGYSVGLVLLNKTKIYINNGGSGKAATATGITYTGGYNGGGTAYYWQGNNTANGSGGGATHIALDSGLLKNLSSHRADGRILIVAGGGGGSALDTSGNGTGKGGNGGGIVGVDGIISSNKDGYYGLGGTQTTGGGYVLGDEDRRNTRTVPSSGTFGRGGDSAPLSNIDNVSGGGAGAGAGFFGGGGAGVWCGAGGGSGYIGSSNLISGGGITKHMTCYSCTTSSVAATRTYSNTNVSETATADYSKTGNGYARITYLGTSI